MPAVLDRPTTKKPKATRPNPAPVQAVVPMAGETQFAFFDRAMRAMRQTIPAVNQRTVAVLRIWRESPNAGTLLGKAVNHFPTDKFTHFGPRCIFLEHEIPARDEETDETGAVTMPGRDGISYGRKEFEKLVNWANYRIANADTFSALSTGHTPSREARDSGAVIPPALGWVGPFYLGMFGDVDPQWAIYADEWIHNEDVPAFERLPRRSPEVWHREPMESRTMDPIAALGSETPRLDSGMGMASYCRSSDDREVMCYSAMSFPGASNAFIPSSETGSKHNYGDASMPFGDPTQQPAAPGGPPMPGAPDPSGGLDPAAISAAVAKVLQDMGPAITQAVVAQLGGGDQPPPEEEAGDDPNIPRGIDAPEDDMGMGDGTDPNQPAPDQAPAPDAGPQMDDQEQQQYAAMSPDCQSSYMAGRQKGAAMVQQYSRNGFDGLKAIVKKQQSQIEKMQSDARDVEVYSKLEAVNRTKQLIGRDGKPATAKSILGEWFDEGLDHAQMLREIGTLQKYARDRDDVADLELFDDPTLDVEQYSRNGKTPRAPQQMRPADKELYSRAYDQAVNEAVSKNAAARKNVTTFEAEFEELLAHPEKVKARR